MAQQVRLLSTSADGNVAAFELSMQPISHAQRNALVVLVSLTTFLVGCARVDVLALPPPLASASLHTEEPVFASGLRSRAQGRASGEPTLRIDQLQLKGSHNSFHRAPRIPLTRRFRYSHQPIEVQLEEQGVRHLELDIRFSAGQLRVGHAPVIDGRTTCALFHECIRAVKRWSKAHPLHVPVFVFVQPKEGLVSAGLDQRLRLLESEIGRVFSRHHLLLPRDVARGFPSLRQAVTSIGWPSLDNTRGKVAFVLFGQSRLVKRYAEGRPRLEGRRMFVADGRAGKPYAAILSIDDPHARKAEIEEAVRSGLLVRTRADSHLRRDPRRRAAALTSGAHFIGSDFVDPKHGWLDIPPEAPARVNPITGVLGGRRIVEVERAVRQELAAPSVTSGGAR